jgi:predicted nucleotidyltransferase component of viral defense system
MRDEGPNLPASVLARLRNAARAMNSDYQLILRRYAIERLLHRLSRSAHSDQYILKGAMLFTAWLKDPFRPTQDLDLLGVGEPDIERVTADIRDIARTEPTA